MHRPVIKTCIFSDLVLLFVFHISLFMLPHFFPNLFLEQVFSLADLGHVHLVDDHIWASRGNVNLRQPIS